MPALMTAGTGPLWPDVAAASVARPIPAAASRSRIAARNTISRVDGLRRAMSPNGVPQVIRGWESVTIRTIMTPGSCFEAPWFKPQVNSYA